MPTGTESAHVEVPPAPSLAPNPPSKSAAEIADELLQGVQDKARLEEIERFHKTHNKRAVSYAAKILGNTEEAEDMVTMTYLELLKGQTNCRHFFNALRCNALNRIKSAKREAKLILRVGELRTDAQDTEEVEETLDDESFLESISSRQDKQDPRGILLTKEELEAAKKIVREDPQYRWVRQKKWWRELERRSEMAFSAEK